MQSNNGQLKSQLNPNKKNILFQLQFSSIFRPGRDKEAVVEYINRFCGNSVIDLLQFYSFSAVLKLLNL